MKKIILSVLFVLCIIVSSILIYFKLHTYSIVALTITAMILIYLINSFFEEETPESIYNKIQ